MRILFFDDDPKRHADFYALCQAAGLNLNLHDLCGAHSIEKAKYFLLGPRLDWAFLDHDLDGQVMVEPGPRTGLAVAQHIAQMPRESQPNYIVLHSMNPVGEIAMRQALSGSYSLSLNCYFGGEQFKAAVRAMARHVGDCDFAP